jgi:hypothetical protein
MENESLVLVAVWLLAYDLECPRRKGHGLLLE